jgi:excisionase family DNA binding protein
MTVGAVDELLDELACRIAERVASRLAEAQHRVDRWLTTREAADHLGMHADTLRRLAGARAIPSEQDGPGCALHFRLSDLDGWREAGGHGRPSVSSEASTRLPRLQRGP